MAAPITWQSIRGDGGIAQAAIPLAGAQRSIGSAFDAFQDIIAKQEAMQRQNVGAEQEIGKQAILSILQSAKSPEELAAMTARGELDTSHLGVKAQAELRAAPEARLTGLRQGAVATNTFDDMLRTRAEQPTIDQIKAMAETDPAAAQALLATSAIRDKAPLAALIHTNSRRGLTESRADAIAPLTLATAQRADTTGQMNLAEAQRVETERVESRRVDELSGQWFKEHQASSANIRTSVENHAEKLGLPRNLGSLDKDQRATLDASLSAAGLPSIGDAVSGDTRAADAFRAFARDKGFKPADMARMESILPQLISTAPKGATGNDAANIAAVDAATTVRLDREDASNWYAPNSPDAKRSYEDLAKSIPAIVEGSTTGFAPKEDVVHVQRLIGEISSVGIQRKDGTFVVPSVQDVMRFVRGSQGGIWNDDARAKDIKEKLTDWVNSPEGIAMAKKGLESGADRDAMRLKQLTREYLNPSPPKK